MVDLFIYDKLDGKTVKTFINTSALLLKSLEKFYKLSIYRDYVIDYEILIPIIESSKFHKHLNPSLTPILKRSPVLKSVLQLQKVQTTPIKTFKAEKLIDNKEEREEKQLKKEVKKAMRDAKRELKKDSEMIQRVRQEEDDKRFRRKEMERKRVRRVLEEESAEFKAMRSQEMQGVKLPPKKERKTRMAGNKMEGK